MRSKDRSKAAVHTAAFSMFSEEFMKDDGAKLAADSGKWN